MDARGGVVSVISTLGDNFGDPTFSSFWVMKWSTSQLSTSWTLLLDNHLLEGG